MNEDKYAALRKKRLEERGEACFEIIPWCPYCGESFSTPTDIPQESGTKKCDQCGGVFAWETEITCSAKKLGAAPGKDSVER